MTLTEEIIIDGLAEEDFRRSIEAMLRQGDADGAAARLKVLLPPHCGHGGLLPERFLTVSPSDIAIAGWDGLGQRLARHDRPGRPISAVSVQAFAPEDDPHGPPRLATCYFSDAPFPFSDADRDDLLEGYSVYGSQWDGDFEEHDEALSLTGIEDLQIAVAELEADLMAADAPPAYAIQAGAIGACYLAVLLHLAVRETARERGLPRKLCLFAGNSGTYPFFDAPVLAARELEADVDAEPRPMEADAQDEAAEMASLESLASLTPRRATKRPVIVLDPAEAVIEHAALSSGHEPEPELASQPEPEREVAYRPEPDPAAEPETAEIAPESFKRDPAAPEPPPAELRPQPEARQEPQPEPPPAAPVAREPALATVVAPITLSPQADEPPMMTTRELIEFLRARDPGIRSDPAPGLPLVETCSLDDAAKTVDSSASVGQRRSRRPRRAEPAPPSKSRQILGKLLDLPVFRALADWLRGS